MADLYTRPYFDSSVWIGWVQHEVIEGIDRRAVADHILRHAAAKAFKIYTSTLSLAEAHKKRHHIPLTEPEDEGLLTYFEHEYIEFIEVDREIGEHANKLCRDASIVPAGHKLLLPNDAIHLACALRAKCDYLLAWDGDLLDIKHPDIKTEYPQMRGQQFLGVEAT